MAFRRSIVTAGLLAFATATPVFAAEVVINDAARAHFTAGVNLLQDPDGARYEEAYREFKAAYAAAPSWKILGNLGISAMKLERDGEAMEAFRKYLAEGGNQVDADERAQFQRDLATLESGVVRLTFESDPPGATLEDERFPATGSSIRNSYGAIHDTLQLGVRPGRHRFVAKLPGRADAVWEVELSPREQQSHVFKLADARTPPVSPGPAPAPSSVTDGTAIDAGSNRGTNGMRIGAYVALGVGAVGLGAGTFFGLQSKSKYSDANELTDEVCGSSNSDCALGSRFGEWEGLRDDADSAKTMSVVGFILGGAGVATGITLLVLSSGKQEEAAAAKVQPYLGLGAMGVRGSF